MVFVLVISEEERGRAKAIIKQTKDNPRRIYNIGLSLVRHVGTDLTPCKEEKSTEGISFFRPIHSHPQEEEKVEKAKKIQDSQRLYLSFLFYGKHLCFQGSKLLFFLEVFKKKIIFFPYYTP